MASRTYQKSVFPLLLLMSGQLNALTKCLSLEEAAAKEKHVRTLIIGTFKTGGPQVFWQNVKDHIPLHSNDIVTWKFLVVLHRLVQDGHSAVPSASRSYCGFIGEFNPNMTYLVQIEVRSN